MYKLASAKRGNTSSEVSCAVVTTRVDPVQDLFETSEVILAMLDDQRELSLRSRIENEFRKSIALSAASMFESDIKDLIERFCHETGSGDTRLASLVKIKILDRQYHTLFSWDSRNANSFFGLFGEAFKAEAQDDVAADGQLEEGIRAFLELGRLRNDLVHNNYATFPFDETTSEVIVLYRKGRKFTDYLEAKLLEPPEGQA